ncbi:MULTISPECIES: helix-turn-helix domain-containing protein [Bacteria]|uniref:helix-turn-helix domain-containing protein n=1 Tax=Bacteria TaxID=2 RepID=UPI003C7C42FC
MNPRPPTHRRARQRQHSLSALGWSARRGGDPSSVELATAATWTVARVWSAPGMLVAHPAGEQIHRVILGVDGAVALVVDGVELTLAPREIVVLPGASTITAESGALWARCEWLLNSVALEHPRLAGHLNTPHRLTAEHYALMTTMTNVISTAPAFGTSAGSRTLLGALAATAATAIVDATGKRIDLSPAQAELVERATDIIEANHRDPDFTVRALFRGMAISETHLHHLFSLLGTTPRQAIEARRVATARSLLALTPRRGPGALGDIAVRAGFRTVRTMQAAIARQERQGGRPNSTPLRGTP